MHFLEKKQKLQRGGKKDKISKSRGGLERECKGQEAGAAFFRSAQEVSWFTILPLLNHKEKNELGFWMPGYIVCQRICQLKKNQLISSSHRSGGYKNRILDGFWNVECTLLLKEENWDWFSSFLKEEKWAAFWGLNVFLWEYAPRCVTSVCMHLCTHTQVPWTYLHILMQKWFTVELVQIFSFFLSSMVRWMIWTAWKGKGKKSFDLSAAELI